MISINYRDARPIYLQIKDNLRKLILTGALTAGTRLPSVRDLAASLAINLNTIQRAYRELESEGYILSIPGKGSFVAEIQRVDRAETEHLIRAFHDAADALLRSGMRLDEVHLLLDDTEKRRTNHD